ncbi:MAG: hypothetical protein K2H10_03065, partial [Bacteroidales bacterium]|nr:hypothetical protein [Bacteroidales bacterium]
MNSKNIIFGTGLILMFTLGIIGTSCSKWTEPQAKDYYVGPSEAYKDNIKDYLNSPHKVMFGWYYNWTGQGGSKQGCLTGLPDSTDFVSLWLCWGNINEAQQADLREFQARGSRAVLCWRAGDIGDNLTPGGNDSALKQEFWGYTPGDSESCVAAAKKYAMAIVDTCRKYNVDGFDYDIEDWGTLMNSSMPEVANEFMRTLRSEFDKEGKMLVADIPGGTSWLTFYDVLENDVLESLDYIVWQTYDLVGTGLDGFFAGSGGVRSHNREVVECV